MWHFVLTLVVFNSTKNKKETEREHPRMEKVSREFDHSTSPLYPPSVWETGESPALSSSLRYYPNEKKISLRVIGFPAHEWHCFPLGSRLFLFCSGNKNKKTKTLYSHIFFPLSFPPSHTYLGFLFSPPVRERVRYHVKFLCIGSLCILLFLPWYHISATPDWYRLRVFVAKEFHSRFDSSPTLEELLESWSSN